MEQCSSRQGTSSSASQEIFHLLQNPKFRYHIRKSLPAVSIMGQMNQVNIFPSYFFKIYLNIILPLTPSIPSGLFPSGFRIKNS
jgi:hypothetical protein